MPVTREETLSMLQAEIDKLIDKKCKLEKRIEALMRASEDCDTMRQVDEAKAAGELPLG